MKIERVIDQLESLRSHCEDFQDKEDPDCEWTKDIAALNFAINIIKKNLMPTKANQVLRKIFNYFDYTTKGEK